MIGINAIFPMFSEEPLVKSIVSEVNLDSETLT